MRVLFSSLMLKYLYRTKFRLWHIQDYVTS